MKRYGMILRIKPGQKDTYMAMHTNMWPEIIAALKESKIRNNSTFVNNELVFMYLEYDGDDFRSDWQTYAENKRVQEWFSELRNYLEPYELPVPPTKWSMLEEAFHLD